MGPTYLDLQAQIGVTKHNGGFAATDRLVELTRIRAGTVLYVGSGIGVGPAYLARRYGCRVVAVDICPEMLRWTAIRAARARVGDRIELAVADVCDLPYPDQSFDAVLVESVLAFVADKPRALAECVRVCRGWVGMNETVWRAEAPPAELAAAANVLGTWLVTVRDWEDMWRTSPLVDQLHELHDLDIREEMISRVAWIGWRWLLLAWGRALRLAARDPAARLAMRQQLGYPTQLVPLMGYVLSAGRRL